MTNEEIIAKFGEAPVGTKWIRHPNGAIALDQEGKPIPRKFKQAMGRIRSKQHVTQYSIPVGKLQSSETPGYDRKLHCALRERDFADPLHFAQWKRDQLKLQVDEAEADIARLIKLGETSETRQKQQNTMRAIDNLKKAIAKDGCSQQLKEQLAELLATIS